MIWNLGFRASGLNPVSATVTPKTPFDWPRGHLAGQPLAKRELCVHTSQTGENFEIFVLFHCHFTRPSIEGQKGVNECSEYVFGVDTSQTVHKVSSSIGQNRGES